MKVQVKSDQMKPLYDLLDDLESNHEMPDQASLYYFSNLESADGERLREMWPSLPVGLRREIITRLVELGEADFEPDFGTLFRVGLDDEDEQVRTVAIEGLWEDEDVFLVPILATRLQEDDSASVRAAAAASLGRFVLLGELNKIRSDPHARAYESLLAVWSDEENLEVRRRTLESLAYTGTEAVVEIIRDAYNAPDEKMHISAVFAMGRNADTCWASQVKQELFQPNPELRYEAARACGELQLREAVPDVEELIDDVDSEVQEAALWALGQIGGDHARQILERCCATANEAMQNAAEAALNELEFMHGDLSEFFTKLSKTPEY